MTEHDAAQHHDADRDPTAYRPEPEAAASTPATGHQPPTDEASAASRQPSEAAQSAAAYQPSAVADAPAPGSYPAYGGYTPPPGSFQQAPSWESYAQQPRYTQPLPPSGNYPQAGGYGSAGAQSAPGAYTAAGGYPAGQATAYDNRPPAKSHTVRIALVSAAIAALVGGGVGAATVAIADDNNSRPASSGLNVNSGSAAPSLKIDGSVTAAAEKIQPSTVTINVRSGQEGGTGSGVIIRNDGYILTNNHVVSVGQGGGTITVVTNDGQRAAAKVVGTDPSDDLAVIKVDGLSNLTAATFGKSSSLVVGQTVVAVGAPLGLSDSVTSGIVSNVARPVTTGDSQSTAAVFNAIQTDASINPGNSGGPLVDLNGNVVGINAAIATPNSGGLNIPGQPQQQSGSIGIGFAIPSDEASRIASELITNGKATKAVIGVQVGGTSSNGSSSATTSGATISSVEANGPAAAAGLQAGDVVTVFGGQRIEDSTALVAAVRSHAPGEKVQLTYLRGGKSNTVTVTLGSATS